MTTSTDNVKTPRTLDREGRRHKVTAAFEAIGPLYTAALAADTEAAWEAFEFHAAILHRQGRLLAGKSKGG